LSAAGGGLQAVVLSDTQLPSGLAVAEVTVQVADAMGAHIVDQVCQRVADALASQPGVRVITSIVSNEPLGRCANARVRVPLESFTRGGQAGAEIGRSIEILSDWAALDRRRFTTNIKGLMNGIDAVAQAFTQDTRALAAGVWSAALGGREGFQQPTWKVRDQELFGQVTLPIACGVVGRGLQADPRTSIFMKLARISTGADLEALLLAVGLMQNLAALHTLVTEGIVAGHGRLHEAAGEINE
jgi:hydroxymethylglutaryl-CoA reductase